MSKLGVILGVGVIAGSAYGVYKGVVAGTKRTEVRLRKSLLRNITNIEILVNRHEYPLTDLEKNWLVHAHIELKSHEISGDRFIRLFELDENLTNLLDTIIRYKKEPTSEPKEKLDEA